LAIFAELADLFKQAEKFFAFPAPHRQRLQPFPLTNRLGGITILRLWSGDGHSFWQTRISCRSWKVNYRWRLWMEVLRCITR